MKTTLFQIVSAQVLSPQWRGVPTPAEIQFIAWMERIAGPSFFHGGLGGYSWRVGRDRVLVTMWMERRYGADEKLLGGHTKLYHGEGHRTEWHTTGGELLRKAVLRLVSA